MRAATVVHPSQIISVTTINYKIQTRVSFLEVLVLNLGLQTGCPEGLLVTFLVLNVLGQ